ncbi:hypothetical protein A4X09_0g5182 [Tilletia walkeri]|uniref:Uncharacterized protein n=1 Tax=Tilletia walkeri TaxID=117179 RepID=A0A8X7N690_9BASI|nr:hypothetical protein A4X09_0g5182 [Tilletia walkeri]
MSGERDPNPNRGSRFNFRDAVRSVLGTQGTTSGSGEGGTGGYEPFPSALHLDTDEGKDSPKDADEEIRVVPYHFPRISDAQLEKLFPLPGTLSAGSATGPSKQETAALRRRQVARAALDEMELNWKLDPSTLGERSDFNQGCAALVALLARVRVGGHDDSGLLDYSPGDPRSLEAQRRKEREDSSAGSGGPGGAKNSGSKSAFVKRWEAHDVLKAIDQQDHETILIIRDQAMDLLLDLSSSSTSSSAAGARSGGGSSGSLKTPLGYSISLGPKWDSTSIVICGALSKFVNSLPDGEEDGEATKTASSGRKRGHKMQLDPRTMQRLRKLKTNLKLAIDHSLFKDQNNLLASYMQVLIMSEGIGWVKDSTDSVQRALETHIRGVGTGGEGGVSANPVSVATDCVLQFITVNLRAKKDKASSVNDYISNAVGDLLLSALWQMVLLRPSEVLPGANETLNPDLVRSIPAYIFARDERVAQHFIDRIRDLRRAIDEARLQEDENEYKRQRARALSTTSRKSMKAEHDEDEDKEEEDVVGKSAWSISTSTASPQRTIQLARNRNMRFLKVAEQMAEELGAAFRTRSEQRLELIKQVLKL